MGGFYCDGRGSHERYQQACTHRLCWQRTKGNPLKHGLVANIALATTDTWRKGTGTNETRTEWHRVVIYGKLVDVIQQYVVKGSQLYIEGKLKSRNWQNQQGQTQYATEVIVDRDGTMQMLGSATNKEKPEEIGDDDASVSHVPPSL